MASKKLGKEDREFQLMQAWWKLFQEFYEVEDTADYNDRHFEAITKLGEDFKDVPLAKHLCLCQSNYWNDRYKAKFGH